MVVANVTDDFTKSKTEIWQSQKYDETLTSSYFIYNNKFLICPMLVLSVISLHTCTHSHIHTRTHTHTLRHAHTHTHTHTQEELLFLWAAAYRHSSLQTLLDQQSRFFSSTAELHTVTSPSGLRTCISVQRLHRGHSRRSVRTWLSVWTFTTKTNRLRWPHVRPTTPSSLNCGLEPALGLCCPTWFSHSRVLKEAERLVEKEGRGHTWSPLGRQLLPPAPNQGHYYNHSYEGDGENRGLWRTSAVLGKRQKAGV